MYLSAVLSSFHLALLKSRQHIFKHTGNSGNLLFNEIIWNVIYFCFYILHIYTYSYRSCIFSSEIMDWNANSRLHQKLLPTYVGTALLGKWNFIIFQWAKDCFEIANLLCVKYMWISHLFSIFSLSLSSSLVVGFVILRSSAKFDKPRANECECECECCLPLRKLAKIRLPFSFASISGTHQ